MSDDVNQLERRLAIHEAQCEERWKTIFKRMEEQESQLTRMENIMIGIAGAVICGGASVVITMVMMHSGA
jgi:fatty acid-binding protein DegV